MSSTPTLLRVKRRIDEDPSEVILLSAKRRKPGAEIEGGGEDSVKILKFAGTVEEGGEEELNQSLSRIISRKNIPNFAELKEKFKKRSQDVRTTGERSKERTRTRGDERFRLVNTNRAIQIEDVEKDEKSPETENIFHLYDIVRDQGPVPVPRPVEDKLSCNGVEMIREYVTRDPGHVTKEPGEANYVYDVYYAEGGELADFDDSLLDGLVSLQPFNTGLDSLYDEYRDDPVEFRYEDDVDSNDEDNEKNDYPDEEDDEDEYRRHFGDYSDDLDLEVGGMRLCEDSEEDSSSSEDEDRLVYTRSFKEDADRHGTSYARYKQRMLKEFKDDDLLEDSEKDEDSDNFDYF